MKKASRLLTLILLGSSIGVLAQNFNHRYEFKWGHRNSQHTCATTLYEHVLAVGTTVDDPVVGRRASLTLVDGLTGFPISDTYGYKGDNISTIANDLIGSLSDPQRVVMVGSYPPYNWPNVATMVFEVDANTGLVTWSYHIGKELWDYTPKAIARDEKKGLYFVFGTSHFNFTPDVDSTSHLFVTTFDKDGNLIWERHYQTPDDKISLSAGDVLYDPNQRALVVTATISENHQRAGGIIASINPEDGTVTNTVQIPSIATDPSFSIDDVIYANNRYVVAGRLNRIPVESYLLQFRPSLSPHYPFSNIYTTKARPSIKITGVRMKAHGDLYASFDYVLSTRHQPNPGLLELDQHGAIKSSYIYKVPDYDYSVGLFDSYGQRGVVIKGATDVLDWSNLSLVSVYTPLSDNEDICSERVKFYSYSDAKIDKFELVSPSVEVTRPLRMDMTEEGAKIRNCQTDSSFNSIEEGDPIRMYPNPNEGIFTVELTVKAQAEIQYAEIYDAFGEMIRVRPITGGRTEFDITEFGRGAFTIHFKSATGELQQTKRIVVE